jgi:hypothetical protein
MATVDPDIRHRFAYHAPDDVRKEQHQLIRDALGAVAQEFQADLPDGREKSLALTKLEEAMFWANAAIARNVAMEPVDG